MTDIDRLYQLPLAAFTQARNELAGQSKANRALVAKLPKPSLAAWAVNQLYWHHRPAYDALSTTALELRTAQAAMMSGQRADVAAAESAHGAALKAATARIRQLLKDAGEVTSAATLTAVSETLQALPSGEPPGRLTRPLKPMGFEALTRWLAPGAMPASATILPFTSRVGNAGTLETAVPETPKALAARERAEARQQNQAARRQAQARAREVKKLEAELHDALATERSAEASASSARGAALAAEREHRELVNRLAAAEDEAARLTRDAASMERAATNASVARQRVEAKLKAIQTDASQSVDRAD